MRKLFLCVMLAVMIFTVGIANAAEVPANPFSSFGLFTDYVTSGTVKLNASGTPDYSGVNSFVANSVSLGGMLKPDADRSSLPVGTVTVLSGDGAGMHYELTPGGSSSGSSFVRYGGFYPRSRVMWNLYTSPDVIAGAADIKSVSDIAPVKIGRNDIVPYVKYTPLSGNNSGRTKFDVYFVKSGDWAAPVAVDYDYVSVNGSIVSDFSSPYPVRHSFTDYSSIYYADTYTVTYGKGNTAYTWRFSIPDSIINWGKLSLDLQPFTLKAGDTETVTVKIPSRYNLSEDVLMSSDVLTVGNSSVLDAELVSFTQGKGWSGNTEDKSRLEFLLTGIAPGRTVLQISIPNVNTYYREIHVTDASGDMNITEGTTSLKPVITHATEACYVEGRPYYPSAQDNVTMITALAGFTGAVQRTGSRIDASGDVQEYTYYTGPGGYIGVDEGARNHIHMLRLDSNTGEKYSVVDSGISYTTNSSDRYYNSEYPGNFSFSLNDSNDINIWLEFPDSPDMNVSSVKLSSLLSRDNIMTTARQLETFAPYFELHHASNDLNTITSLDWSFVNPSTMKPVTPSGVTDITVNGQSVSGTSGTVNYNNDYGSYIIIQYSYGGNVYIWAFTPMSQGNDSRFRVPENIETGKTVSVDTSMTVNSGEIYIWDRDILSADPTVFTSADRVSFSVKRLKDGLTSLSLIFPYSESSSPFNRYRAYRTTTTAGEIAPSSQRELSAKFIVPSSRIPIVEGKPYYGESGVSFQDSAEILLECKEPMTWIEYSNIYNNLTGTLYVSYDVPIYNDSGDVVSHDTVEESDTLYPSGNSYSSGGVLYVTLSYNRGWHLLQPGRTVRWEFPSGLIKSGRAKIPEFDTRKAANLLPNLTLHREGLNAGTLEWTFTDSKDNLVTAPSNVVLNVYNSRGTISSDKGTGSIAVNLPEVFINEISMSYELDGVNYRFDFRPVDRPDYYDSARSTWNATSHDLPLAMRKGESRAVTLSVSGDYGKITPLIGNPDIVSMSVISSTDSTVTVRLTAKESGMTTLGTMYQYKLTEIYYVYESPDVPPTPVTRVNYYGNYVAWPREIWVSELDTSTGKYRVPHLTDDVDTLMESLKPGNASSWTEYSTVSPDKAGTVTDEPEYDESTKDVGYDGLSVYPRFAMPKDPSADAYSAVWDFVDGLNLPYGVDMFNDDNMRVIASRDAAEVWKAMKDELLSADVPQLVAIVLPEIYIYEPGFYVFRLPADNITGRNQAIFWSAERSGDVYSMYHRGYYVTSADLNRQIFIDDSGNLTGAVSGDEYISVAAYFAEGVYRPVITAAATSHDLEILRGLPAEPSPDVRPTSPDIRPTSPDVRPTSPDVRPTSPDVRPTSPDVRPTSPDLRPTSPDIRPTSPDVTPNPARPTKPGINVQEKASSLRDILSRPGSIVAELPESSAGASRTVSDLPASQLTAITEQGREVAVVLPEITVETAAIYVFGVSLDNLTPGDTIFLDMTLTSVSAGSVNASANYEGDYAFLDDDGNEVYTVPANRHVNVAAYLEPNYVYSPAITTSGNSSEGDNVIGLASSSGGCSAGFGGVILLAGLALISRKKH